MTAPTILITGAGGFVGRNLAEFLSANGHRVLACSHKELDLLDESAVRDKLASVDPYVIIHCASVGGERKTGYDEGRTDVVAKNLRMFFNLARCLKSGMRMLQMGSGGEYDKRRSLRKIPEDRFEDGIPADAYGYSKYVISKYSGRTGNITCLRIFGLYGKYEDYTYKFISNAIVKNLAGLPITINRNVVFDYLWIGDLCRVIEKLLLITPKHRHYNVTPTVSADLVSLAELVNSAAAVKSEIRVLNPGLNAEYTGDNRRLLEEMGDFKFTPYEDGIKPLYSYYAARLKELDLETVKKDPYLKACRISGGAAAGGL